jgi:hypothetical protein
VFLGLGLQKRRVFSCLGRDGSDGQACHVPGPPWPSKSAQNCHKGRPCDVSFSTSQVACYLFLLWFSGGSDPRSARAGAIETQFCMFDVAFKGLSFLIAFWKHFWYIWRRNLLKRHVKLELENKSCKSVFVLLSLSFLPPFRTHHGPSFRAFGA